MESDSTEMANEVQNKVILHWNCRGLVELPEVIRIYGNHIQEIYLKWNKLTTLPPWIIELFNVTNLYIYGNLINELPQEIGGMQQLTVLDLSANALKEVPISLGQLANLKSLLLNSNFIERLPPELEKLQNLEILSLSGNKLLALPEWIGSLPRLKELNADNNCLREIPNRLTMSSELSLISVCSNRLRFLPMNGFLSSPTIRFEANVHLNYFSYPLLFQLISHSYNLMAHEERNMQGHGCHEEDYARYASSRSIILKLNLSPIDKKSSRFIELPRQLIKAHNIRDNVTTSLWELALRKVYTNRYKHTLNISSSPVRVNVLHERNMKDQKFELATLSINHIFYNLLLNGPASICVNNHCQQPIFTEAWIITGAHHRVHSITIVALCCCQRCAIEFMVLSKRIILLDWIHIK